MQPEPSEQEIGRDSARRIFVIRVKEKAAVRITELIEALRLARAAVQAGEGAEIVDDATGEVIEQHPPGRYKPATRGR
jgi:hypothetical protein